MYVNFIIKKKYPVKAVASDMDIATDTLYRYIRGENVIPPDRVIDLIKATKDFEFLDFFCDPVDCIAVPKEGTAFKQQADLKQIEIDYARISGGLLDVIEKAKQDGVIDENEFKEISKFSLIARRKIAELVEKIKRDMK